MLTHKVQKCFSRDATYLAPTEWDDGKGCGMSSIPDDSKRSVVEIKAGITLVTCKMQGWTAMKCNNMTLPSSIQRPLNF